MAQSTTRVGSKLAVGLSLMLLLLVKCSWSQSYEQVTPCNYDPSKWSGESERAQRHFTIVANGTLSPHAFRRYVAAAYSRLCQRAANDTDTLQLVQFADAQVITSVSRRSAFGNETHRRLCNVSPAATDERPANGSVAGLCAALAPVGRLVAQPQLPCPLHEVIAAAVHDDAACYHSASAQLVLDKLRHSHSATTPATDQQHVVRVRRAAIKGPTGTAQSTPDDEHTEYKSDFKHQHPDKQLLIVFMSSTGIVTGLLFLLITGALFVRKLQLNHRGVAVEQKQSAGNATSANANGNKADATSDNKADGSKKTT